MKDGASDPVVVTGIGAVSAAGLGVEALAAALAGGETPRREVDLAAGYHRRGAPRTAALLDRAALRDSLPPRLARRLGVVSQSAVAAAREALAAAELTVPLGPAGERTAVVVATRYGSTAVTEELARTILERDLGAASPFLFPESVASAAAAHLALDAGARGPNLTFTQRAPGALLAVSRAAGLLRRRRADRVLVAAVDEVDPLLHAVLGRFGALARAADGEVARPFDRRRTGLVLGEGAVVLVLERASAARGRGVAARARVLGGGGGFDPSAPAHDWGDGAEGLAATAATLLDRLGVAPGTVDRVVSGSGGARRGDRLEARVLRRLLPDLDAVPVLAPKAGLGDCGLATLAAATLAATGGGAGPTPGFAEVDPELEVTPHDGTPRPPARLVLASELAPGGSAAWLLLSAA